jgi:DNA-binding NtrC family response regulator
VLVVDDDETVRATAGRILKNSGHLVEFAENGERAVEIFRLDPTAFDLVLMDLTMPRMDGVATFRELKRILKSVRVILMSGFSEQDSVNQFTGKGLASFIQKPFKPDQLEEVVDSVLGNNPSSSESGN